MGHKICPAPEANIKRSGMIPPNRGTKQVSIPVVKTR
jgi:hypothetical protein